MINLDFPCDTGGPVFGPCLVFSETREMCKKIEKVIDKVHTPFRVVEMANQPDPDKRVLTVRIERSLYARIKKRGKELGLNVSDMARRILRDAVELERVVLTSQDYEQIKRETKEAEEENARRQELDSQGR